MSKSFINKIETIDIENLLELKYTHKLLCLYDSKINSLDQFFITSNKLDTAILKNLTMFVSNKNTFSTSPIIILNKLNSNSLNLVKNDPVLKSPQKYNISLIFIGTEEEYNIVYG